MSDGAEVLTEEEAEAFAPTDDDTIDEAAALIKMSSSDPPEQTGGGDPPAEDPPFTQSTHVVNDYPTSDDEEVIDEEIIEEEILTDGEETIEEEIIEEEVTEGSLRKEEDAIKSMTAIPEEGGGTPPEKVSEAPASIPEEPAKDAQVPPVQEPIVAASAVAAAAPVDAPPSPGATADAPDATASPTRGAAPKMDNDLAAFMERRRRAADSTEPSHLDDEKTAHMSNLEQKDEEPAAVPPPSPAPVAAPPPSLFEQQRSYEQAQQPPAPAPYEAGAEEEEEEPEPQQQDRALPAAVAGAAVGGAAMYYAQQQDQDGAGPVDLDDEEEYEDEAEPMEEEEYEEPPVAQPVASYQPTPYQQQSQQSPYGSSPYQQQQSPYSSQRSPYVSSVPPASGPVDVEGGPLDEQPRDDDKNARGAPEQASSGPTWGCFALCCCIAVLLIAAAVILGIFLSDDDDPGTRAVDITPITPPPNASPTPGQPTQPSPGTPTPPPTFGPVTTIKMELGEEVSGPIAQGYGAAIAVSSNKLAVGAPFNETGTVFSYLQNGGTWELLTQNQGPNAGSQLGFSLDMNTKNSLIIGAPEANVQGRELAVGSVYYFTFQADTESWELQGDKIQGGRFADNVNEKFGEAVALSSSTVRAAVGAPQHKSGAGRVYMFELTGGAWTPMGDQELVGADGALLGSAVDMSEDGTVVAAGSPGTSSFQIYEWIQGQWVETHNEKGNEGTGLGTSIAVLSNNYVAVGSPGVGGTRGMIRLFEKKNGSWGNTANLQGSAGQKLGSKGLLTGTADPDPELTFGTAGGQVRRFDYIRGDWAERFTINTVLNSLSSLAIDKESDAVKLWVGSSQLGKAAEYVASATPAPVAPVSARPTLKPTSAPTRTLAPTTETKYPTTSPTDAPTRIPAGSGWVAFNGPFTVPGEGHTFGSAVAVDGEIMAAGAPQFSNGIGAVQAYRKIGTNWYAMATMFDRETQRFGEAVDVAVGSEWTSMIIGAPQTFDNGDFTNLKFGSVQYLQMVNNEWSDVGGIIRPEATVMSAGGEFGAAVAVAADTRRIAVGAPQTNLDQDNLRNGRVFTYVYDDAAGDFVQLAPPLDGFSSGDRFGSAIAMNKDGSRLLVGAPGAEGASAGSITYFGLENGEWKRLLPLPGSTDGENLGTSVAIIAEDGETIAMGAPNFDGGKGVVRVYRNTKRANQVPWEQVGGDIVGEAGDMLGTTLSGADGRVVVGTANGGFKMYRLVSNGWTEENDGPETGSPVVSVAANSDKEVIVGLANEEVAVYGLF